MKLKMTNKLQSYYQEAKSDFLGFFMLLSYIVLSEFILWTSHDYIVFNEYFFGTKFQVLFYILPSILTFVLSVILVYTYDKIPNFLRNLMLLITSAYLMTGIQVVTHKACREIKNEGVLEKIIIILLISVSCYLIIKKVLPRMTRRELIITSVATVALVMDLTSFWIGYYIFYPGFW